MFTKLFLKRQSKSGLLILLFLVITNFTQAANYYWRATAVSGLYTNIANWETSPGGGLSPSTAPGINDDVFFPVASSFSTINLNNGNCHDFNVTASALASFSFSGVLTAINGSLNCPNGNANFAFTGSQNFIGTGTHFINMGTNAIKITGGSLVFVNAGSGTYSLNNHLNTNSNITFSSQNFNSNGYDMSFLFLTINGTSSKTINLTSTKATLNSNGGTGGQISFSAPHTTTNYTFTNTHFTINHLGASGMSGITIDPGVQVSFDSLTLNATATSDNIQAITIPAISTTVAILNINVLRLNISNLSLGAKGFSNTLSGIAQQGRINIGTLYFQKPSTISSDMKFEINVGSILEPSSCSGQSLITSNGYYQTNFNTTSPITTSTIAYSGINFGGSGITASTSSNLGNNAGTVSWGAATSGISYWWVGGTGNWDDPTKWSIIGSGGTPQLSTGCLPTLQDNVYFDANSFTSSQTVTIKTTNAFCKDINWTGSNLGLLTGGLTASTGFSGNLYINGNADYTGARGIGANLFYVGGGSQTITSGTFFAYTSPIQRVMCTGTYTLADNLPANSSYFQHTAGSFSTGGKTMHVDNFSTRSMPEISTNTRNLTITNSDINVWGTDGAGGRRFIDISFLSSLNASNSNFKMQNTTAYFAVGKGNSSPIYLSPVNLNNVSFMSTSGTSLFETSASVNTVNYNDVSFAANATINNGFATTVHNVNNYNLANGFTYSFNTVATDFNVLTGINTVASPCQDLVRIQSQTLGARARIKKATSPFTVNGAIVTDINSTGTTMSVTNGVDAGNNNNVTVSAGVGRNMYWVGNSGNWSDASHWSINASGGNPAINNTFNCIPRAIDNVIFDNNSFSTSAQTVTMDVDGNCRSMVWTAAAGADAPIYIGVVTRNLNVYDSLELATGMTSPYLGKITMMGTSTLANDNSIDMNGVNTYGSIYFNGGGRYDLVDSVHIVGGANGIKLNLGNFVTNGENIYADAMYLNVQGSNAADISNSYIKLVSQSVTATMGLNSNTYTAYHDATGVFNAMGSTIEDAWSIFSINNTAPVSYGTVIMNNSSVSTVDIIGNASNKVTFKNVIWLQAPTAASGGSFMDGVFEMDTLQYPTSSFNTLATGGLRSYTVKKNLMVYGTPCSPAFIRSATAGTAAPISSALCNFDLNFVNLRDIAATTCTAAQNKAIGTDEGGNSNWTITSIAALTKMGNDTSILCKYTPYNQGTTGFGVIPGMTYAWGGGETTNAINIDSTNTYSVNVTYATGCDASDTRIITVNPLPPVVLASGNEQISPNNCYKNNYVYFEGAAPSSSFDLAILAINPNGNSISPSTVKVNNQGTLVDAVGTGTFTNTGSGYYQNTDGVNSLRITKRLHTIVAPGTYTTGGGVKVRVYYTAADTSSMLSDAWPGGATTSASGWFKHKDHTAQEVVDSMQPGFLKGAIPLTPIAYGTESGVKYAEFLVTSFSTIGFLAATTAAPLPLHLISFEAQKIADKKALLNWHTGVENQVAYLELEHSINGSDWQGVYAEKAKGSNSSYSYIHNSPIVGINLYRLKIVDLDGGFLYSPTKSLSFGNSNDGEFHLFPNPAVKNVTVAYSNGTLEGAQIQFINAIGQHVINQMITNKSNSISYDISQLPKGLYIVRLVQNGNSFSQNLIIE